MASKEVEKITPKNKKEWREWLKIHHETETSIWLVMYKKSSEKHNISWSDAVDEALCFGWIDSVKKSIDNEKAQQFFSKRKAQSTWSKINKDKVALFIEQNLMFPAGLKTIDVAKTNGSWTFLDSIDQLIIPEDLKAAFTNTANSKEFYLSLSISKQKMLLYFIKSAKRPETRAKRIDEIVKLASENKMPKQFR